MREQSAGIREQPGWRAEGRDEASFNGLLPPISVWLSSVGNPRMGLGAVRDAPLTVRYAAPYKDRWGGSQIQEGKVVSSALAYPLPFSPIPLLPP